MPTDTGTVTRRPGERRNFIASLQEYGLGQASQEPEQFQTILASAVDDYQVPVSTLAAKLGVKEGMIQSWFQGDKPVTPPVPTIEAVLNLIAEIMNERLRAEAAKD